MGNIIQKEETKFSKKIKQLKVPDTMLVNHIAKLKYNSITEFNDICNQFLECVDYKSEHLWSEIENNQKETDSAPTTRFSITNFFYLFPLNTFQKIKMKEKLKDLDFLLKYAKTQEVLADFEEALLAYKECVNISKSIVNEEFCSAVLKDEMMQFALKCIERGTVVKNVLDSQNLIKVDKVSQKQNRLDEDERKKIENDQALSQYLESDEAQDWTEKQKRKIVEMSRLIWISKFDVSFADIVGLEQAKTAVKTCIIDRLRNPKFSKCLTRQQPKGILFYGGPRYQLFKICID